MGTLYYHAGAGAAGAARGLASSGLLLNSALPFRHRHLSTRGGCGGHWCRAARLPRARQRSLISFFPRFNFTSTLLQLYGKLPSRRFFFGAAEPSKSELGSSIAALKAGPSPRAGGGLGGGRRTVAARLPQEAAGREQWSCSPLCGASAERPTTRPRCGSRHGAGAAGELGAVLRDGVRGVRLPARELRAEPRLRRAPGAGAPHPRRGARGVGGDLRLGLEGRLGRGRIRRAPAAESFVANCRL